MKWWEWMLYAFLGAYAIGKIEIIFEIPNAIARYWNAKAEKIERENGNYEKETES